MNRSEATKILAVLAAAYPEAKINKVTPEEAEGIVGVWVIQFASIPADIVFMAVNKHISKVKYFPTISEIKDKISALHWEAYDALSTSRKKFIHKAAHEDYKRIYELTQHYKMGAAETELNVMMISNSKQFLIKG